jgi:hypothetical protein
LGVTSFENLIVCYSVSWVLKCASTAAFFMFLCPKVFKRLRAAKEAEMLELGAEPSFSDGEKA